VIIAVIVLVVVLLLGLELLMSLHKIGASDVGLVTKNFGSRLPEGSLIARHGEAGYQPDLLMPGWRMKLWPIYRVTSYPWVQIPPGAIGVVIAQVGAPLDPGAKSARYSPALGDFSNLAQFLENGGQRGVQRPVLQPGVTLPIHPMAFVVATVGQTFGVAVSDSTSDTIANLSAAELSVTYINPQSGRGTGALDVIGVVTTLEGPPLPSGDIAGRIGGFEDVLEAESANTEANEIIQLLLGSKNDKHNNYQDFQAFLDSGGCIGLQHDPLLYGAYLLNPFLVRVEIVPMLVVNQGEVAVIKSYVGLPTMDTSGDEYRFGSIVSPGHRGIWSDPLRTGKYPLNPRIYTPDVIPTSILTLNWAAQSSEAHDLDARLSSIDAKSKEAFNFKIDLQVQIHVPDTKAPKVIGMVGTMQNLVNEVLQSAVGNYFRNKVQGLAATEFIQQRDAVQEAAETYVTEYLRRYDVEVRGVYIQDVVFPPELVEVLTRREIARQEKATYAAQQDAQQARIALEAQRGEADMQQDLAKSRVSVEINKSNAEAAVAAAEGTAQVTRKTSQAEADKIAAIGKANASAAEALGMANAKSTEAMGLANAKSAEALGLANAQAYTAQKEAIGAEQTAVVAIVEEVAKHGLKITPDVLVGGGNGDGQGGVGALASLIQLALMKQVSPAAAKALSTGNGSGSGKAAPPDDGA
jgi:uncharacterized membrane protein YqiK